MKIIEWFKNPILPETVCLVAGHGFRCKICWTWTIGIIGMFAAAIWLT